MVAFVHIEHTAENRGIFQFELDVFYGQGFCSWTQNRVLGTLLTVQNLMVSMLCDLGATTRLVDQVVGWSWN